MAEIEFETDEENPEAEETLEGVEDLIEDEPSGFFTRRRAVIIGGIVGLVFIIGAVFFFLRILGGESPSQSATIQQPTRTLTAVGNIRPKKNKKKIKYATLFNQMTQEDASKVIKELTFAGISFESDQNGNNYAITVDRDYLEEARSLLAIKGVPTGGSKGFELLDDSQTLGVTEFDKRVRFLRALSGEIEKAIIQFDAIESVKVQIVLPEQRLFAVTQPPVTSSILLRKSSDYELTDDLVFSIIQLVSNAVENLQPENVSIIDTTGRVLSGGIFERMALKEAGLFVEEEVEEEIIEPQGQPIIPDYQNMGKWFQVKLEFEKNLENKAIKQLLGILPIGSFKLSITADLGAIDEGEVLDVKRLTTSIVVDSSNDDIYLDQLLKRQIFNTIAGSIGYLRGRDTILLSKSDLLIFTKEEMERLEKIEGTGGLKWWQMGPLFGIPVLIASFAILRYMKRKEKLGQELLKDDSDLNIEETDTTQESIDRIKITAASNPEWIAGIMEEWLKEQPTEEVEEVPA